MVRIRMRRVGGKNQPSFRIVAADKESPRDGRFIEVLGFYNPRTEPATIQLKEDRIYDWMSKGAQPSESAMQVFQVAGLVDRYERFKSGEDIEKLMAEADEAEKTRNVGTKTRHEPPVGTPGRKKKEAEVKAAEAQEETVEEPKAEEAPKAEAKQKQEEQEEKEEKEEKEDKAEADTEDKAEESDIEEEEKEEAKEEGDEAK